MSTKHLTFGLRKHRKYLAHPASPSVIRLPPIRSHGPPAPTSATHPMSRPTPIRVPPIWPGPSDPCRPPSPSTHHGPPFNPTAGPPIRASSHPRATHPLPAPIRVLPIPIQSRAPSSDPRSPSSDPRATHPARRVPNLTVWGKNADGRPNMNIDSEKNKPASCQNNHLHTTKGEGRAAAAQPYMYLCVYI